MHAHMLTPTHACTHAHIHAQLLLTNMDDVSVLVDHDVPIVSVFDLQHSPRSRQPCSGQSWLEPCGREGKRWKQESKDLVCHQSKDNTLKTFDLIVILYPTPIFTAWAYFKDIYTFKCSNLNTFWYGMESSPPYTE